MRTERLWDVCPPEPSSISKDPSLRLAQLASAGYSQLAADSILSKDNQGKIVPIIEKSIARLDEMFGSEDNLATRKRCVDVLLEVVLNFLGMERKRAGFSGEESSKVLEEISRTLRSWERSSSGAESVRGSIEQLLGTMKLVLSGKGMVARMAEEIQGALVREDLAGSFIEAAKRAIQENVYYRIVDGGLSKFGNDSATGLRWARHLGAVQVSSNPVIAARAYEEIPDLWTHFEAVASSHPEWRDDPERYADEIALYGTVTSLLPNILDFRPIALLSDFEDGMVSIQLNPQKASSVEESTKDALKFYSILEELLEDYDAYLTSPAARPRGRIRPNVVFKVSTSQVGAIDLTERLDGMGIGTNNTVTFTAAQEIQVSLAAIRGLAEAAKKGIPIGTIYITNMEGRLEDHLREHSASRMLHEALEKSTDKEGEISKLAQKIGAVDTSKGLSLEERIDKISNKKYLKSLADGWFADAVGPEKTSRLRQMEDDIRMSGIYVTRKVFQVLFKPSLKPKLVSYVEKEFGLKKEAATKVVEAVNLLPASKRRAEDTYLVLADKRVSNLTNTEFPDHQLKVLQRSRESGFRLSDFEDSIASEPDPSVLKRLLEISDFRKAYELNRSLVAELKKIGIEVPAEEVGLEPEQWASYGPARKTMDEFDNAYVSFRGKLLSSIRNSSKEKEREIAPQAK